ncbi:hemerythrin domain-containing protein [Nonomuraea indica]|uniref:hemerythrin domain-containing protein n=1 Tax=Nonomuraea indica TaxID=1581193 RepID=UPI000C7A102A|nr:hemerythrin domain-containing protein [Nonomuraea indica]
MTTDVITLITSDHRKVETLFERLQKKQGDQRATVAELHALLIAHARAEEDRVYPGIDAHHGVEEHKEAEVLLDSLVRAEPGTAEFEETLVKLVEAVSHHVEEEENELLPELAKQAGEKRLKELGAAFAQRRDEELRALAASNGSATSQAGGASPTKEELYRKAQEADIPGRSQMSKDELEKAVGKAGS